MPSYPTVKAEHDVSDEGWSENGRPGSYRFTKMPDGSEGVYGIIFKCPCGCGSVFGGRFVGANPWTWDGNRDSPTVTPSFGCGKSHEAQSVGPDGFHWHGFLTAGVFAGC